MVVLFCVVDPEHDFCEWMKEIFSFFCEILTEVEDQFVSA